MEAVELELQPILREEGKSDRSKLGSRPCPSSLRIEAPVLQPRLAPPSPPATPTRQPTSCPEPFKGLIPPKDKLTPPTTPYNSFSPPTPAYVAFPLPPDHIIGYGRYRQWRCTPKKDILAHIDAQIADVSGLLIRSNMLDCKIPGYDDITFGERLWAKSEGEMDEARNTLKPSSEKSSDGTVIHHGFPEAERIIMRATARSCLSTLLADELIHHNQDESPYRCRSFDPMGWPDKGNTEAWGKIGFTLHPLPAKTRLVRRKWNELEKLPPKWGPMVAKREEAERYRQEQKAAAYIRALGNAAGCFRVADGPSVGGYQVNVSSGKVKLGDRIDPTQISQREESENGNDDRAKALEDIENAIASDSDSEVESNYNTAYENAIESDCDCDGESPCSNDEREVELTGPLNIPKSYHESHISQPMPSPFQPKAPEIETSTAPNSHTRAISTCQGARIKANVKKSVNIPRTILKDSTCRPALPPCQPKSPEVDTTAASTFNKSASSPNVDVSSTSPPRDTKAKAKAKANDYEANAAVLSKRRVVRFAV